MHGVEGAFGDIAELFARIEKLVERVEGVEGKVTTALTRIDHLPEFIVEKMAHQAEKSGLEVIDSLGDAATKTLSTAVTTAFDQAEVLIQNISTRALNEELNKLITQAVNLGFDAVEERIPSLGELTTSSFIKKAQRVIDENGFEPQSLVTTLTRAATQEALSTTESYLTQRPIVMVCTAIIGLCFIWALAKFAVNCGIWRNTSLHMRQISGSHKKDDGPQDTVLSTTHNPIGGLQRRISASSLDTISQDEDQV